MSAAAIQAAKRIIANEAEYRQVESWTGVPAVFVGLVHHMEADCDLDRQVLNGEPVQSQTVNVPTGRGPWVTFGHSGFDIFQRRDYCRFAESIETTGWYLEKWNGWGYAKQGKDSPYLFAGTRYGEGVGKYTSDRVYDPDAVSGQVGAYAVLAALIKMGASIMDNPPGERNLSRYLPLSASGSWPKVRVAEIQEMVNLWCDGMRDGPDGFQRLAVDGLKGPKTRAAIDAATG
jgi:lysozyme family protein